MNRWLCGVSFFLMPFFVQAQWNTSRHYGTGYWTVSDGSAEAACDEAKRGALSTYENMKKRLIGHPYGWEAKYKLDDQCEVPQAGSDAIVVKWWITIDIGKDDKEDKRKACLAKPVVNKTYSNVYKIGSDYYANVDGCQYIATGTIVPIGNTVAADWKPTGELVEEGSESGSSESGEQTGSGEGSGENGGSGSGTASTGGSGGSSGHSLSKDDVVSAVKMGVSDLPTEIKQSLVEDYNIVDDTLKADEKSKGSLKSISDSLGNLLKGAGKFVDRFC